MKKILLLIFLATFAFAVLFGCMDSSDESTSAESVIDDAADTSTEGSKQSSAGENASEDISAESQGSESSEDEPLNESSTDESKETSTESSADISDDPSNEPSQPPEDDPGDEPSQPPEDDPGDEPSQPPEDDPGEEPSQPPEDDPGDEPSQPPEDDPDNPNGSEDPPVFNDIGDAEILPTGFLIYNGAAYSQTYYNASIAQNYADIYARYAEIFPDVRINVVNPPVSGINVVNPLVAAMINDQAAVLDNMERHIYGRVNFVNLKNIFKKHLGEYLFFKSDYHWTQLGAYYAYTEYAKSVGLTSTPLSAFEKKIVTDQFIGKTEEYAHDDRILTFIDTVYAYMPTKTHTMAVYNKEMKLQIVYKNCIQTSIKNYSCFLTGDQPFSVIEVPENDQNKTVLIIKESSGNAFVPFLTEHYGKILVIDPRQFRPDVRELVKEYGVDDIIFFATASTSNSSAYCDFYRELIRE